MDIKATPYGVSILADLLNVGKSNEQEEEPTIGLPNKEDLKGDADQNFEVIASLDSETNLQPTQKIPFIMESIEILDTDSDNDSCKGSRKGTGSFEVVTKAEQQNKRMLADHNYCKSTELPNSPVLQCQASRCNSQFAIEACLWYSTVDHLPQVSEQTSDTNITTSETLKIDSIREEQEAQSANNASICGTELHNVSLNSNEIQNNFFEALDAQLELNNTGYDAPSTTGFFSAVDSLLTFSEEEKIQYHAPSQSRKVTSIVDTIDLTEDDTGEANAHLTNKYIEIESDTSEEVINIDSEEEVMDIFLRESGSSSRNVSRFKEHRPSRKSPRIKRQNQQEKRNDYVYY